MPAHKPSPLCTKHGTTPNASPPCSDMEGLCPQPASEDSGDLCFARADPCPCYSVCAHPGMCPISQTSFSQPCGTTKVDTRTGTGLHPGHQWGFVTCFGSRTGFCRVVWEALGATEPCERGWQGSAAAGNVPGRGKQTAILDAGKILWQVPCKHKARQSSI